MIKALKNYYLIFAGTILLLISLLAWGEFHQAKANTAQAADWRSDWAVPEGFSLSIDTEGYQFPTAIAFVPQPGLGPKDPLYFVTELGGAVKVITNDRTVYTFANHFFERHPKKDLPDIEGQTGLAGICLDAEHGYVFVTFAYQDEQGTLRNNVLRFQSKTNTFAVEPINQVAFTEVFDEYESVISHQIGACQVANGLLYVSVGDARQTEQSQKPDSVLGKVLRMTLDGQPVPDNPYFQDEDIKKAANFVWASGLRNPFGLKAVGARIFVADNGSNIDRFLEVEKGKSYLWDGSDWSIGASNNVAFSPNIGPVQVEYSPESTSDWPEEYQQNFFIAASKPEMAGVVRVKYSLDEGRAIGAPDYFIKYQGTQRQIVTGVALGPDGLYYVPTLPNAQGHSPILRVAYNPEQQHPYLISNIKDPAALMQAKGCLGCHRLGNEGGTVGPPLDQRTLVSNLETRLNSEEYIDSVTEIDRLDQEPYLQYKASRNEVLQARGQDKLRTWMIYHFMEPRFDNQYAQMPNLGLSKSEATAITNYLLKQQNFSDRVKSRLLQFLPTPLIPRYLLFAFGVGFVLGAIFLLMFVLALRWRRSRVARLR